MRFKCEQEKQMERLLIIKQIVAEQQLHDSDCLLLASQLNELIIFTEKILELAKNLQASLESK